MGTVIKEERYQAPRGYSGWYVVDTHTPSEHCSLGKVLKSDCDTFAEAAAIAEGLNDGTHEVFEIDGVEVLLITV